MIARLGGRRLVLFAALAVAGMLAGALTAVQIRAAQAQDRREDAALAAQLEAADADADTRPAAQRELAEDWSAAVRVAEGVLGDAEEVLAASAGAVPDDAVRVALADAVAGVLAAVDVSEPTRSHLSALRAATTGLTAATTVVEGAVADWRAAQAAAAAPVPAPAPPRSGGAGPDCGGPESYEPPDGGLALDTSTPSESGDGTNGRVPRSQLTALAWCVDSQGNSQWLRTDAAQALTQLNDAFRERFGENLAIDLSYRSYEDQVRAREIFGSIAATPGTSNHGLGTAIDTWEWRAYSFGSERYEWLVANGPNYGWVAPDWARQGGSNPEYWHFEYTG